MRTTAEGATCHCDTSSPNQFQTCPEGDGNEPRGGSNLTGPEIRTERMVTNGGLCNKMRTVSEHDGWRKRNVRRIRLLELLLFPKRKAPFEGLDPGCWRGICKFEVEDNLNVAFCTYNLLNCPRCVQRRCIVEVAPGEESCDCREQISKKASVPWNLSPTWIRFGKM